MGFYEKHKFLYVAIIVLLITLIFAFLLLMQFSIYSDSLSIDNEQMTQYYEDQFNTILSLYKTVAQTYYQETIMQNPGILEILSQANSAGAKERQKLRDELYFIIRSSFENAAEQNFKEIHFHLKDNSSFLRIDSPDNYSSGDKPKERQIVKLCNETLQFIEGFEVGSLSDGYRYIFPLFDNAEHIGCVEISTSLAVVSTVINELFETQSVFLLKESPVKNNTLMHTDSSDMADDYYYDWEIYSKIFIEKQFQANTPIMEINKAIKQDIADRLDIGEDFVISTNLHGIAYSVIFYSVQDYAGNHVGYMVFYKVNDAIKALYSALISKYMLISFLYVATLAIMILLLRSRRRLMLMANSDSMTGLYNSRGFYNYAKFLYQSAQSRGNLTVCYLDIDNMKQINDTYGHEEGDEAIKSLAKLLKRTFRKADVIARLGGDEFALCCRLDEVETLDFADRLYNNLKEFNNKSGKQYDLSLSIGCARKSENVHSLEDMIRQADKRMYINKVMKKESR